MAKPPPAPVEGMSDKDLADAADHYRIAERISPLRPSWAWRYAQIVAERDRRAAKRAAEIVTETSSKNYPWGDT